MSHTSKQKESGFTIIEVVLVLAIAGLIFLIVFLALPQLQRSRRDTQRRSDAGRVVAALESYASNNNGEYPDPGVAAQTTAFTTSYTQDIEGPEVPYTYSWGATLPVGFDTDDVHIEVEAGLACDNATALGARQVAVRMGLEQGTFCQDNF